MSRHLFTYADVLRIMRSVTPVRAPERAEVEAVRLVFIIGEALLDLQEAFSEATAFRPFTLPKDLILDLERRFISTVLNLGESAFQQLIEMLLPKEEPDASKSD